MNSKKFLIASGIIAVSALALFAFKNPIISAVVSFKENNFAKECIRSNSKVNSFEDFLSCKVPSKTVAIFEPNPYHHECMPGYAKYFTDMGYNVDTLIVKNCEDALSSFSPENNLRIFTFDNLETIEKNAKKINKRFEKYDYVLIQTTDPNKAEIYKKLGVVNMPNALFVAHDTEWVKSMEGFEDLFNQNRVLTLGNFKDGLQVNPHYFGDFEKKEKNQKTRFFITSSGGRNYSNLTDAAEKLKKEGLDFEILVVGRGTAFNIESIPENLKDKFIFKHRLPFNEMYQEVLNSDYIIINLDPKNENDNAFKNLRVSGAAQLCYGFSKPALIHKEFADNYGMTDENSFIYNDSDFTEVMKKAIKLSKGHYKEKQINLIALSNKIYNISLENIKKAMKIH